MTTITLHIDDTAKEKLICDMATQLNLSYEKESQPHYALHNEEMRKTLLKKMQILSEKIKKGSFPDASQYQREVREDNIMPTRF